MVKVYIIIFLLYGAGFAAARHVAGPELRRDLGWPLLAFVLAMTALTFVKVDLLLFGWLYGVGIFVGTRTRMDALCRYVLLSMLMAAVSAPFAIGGFYLLIFSSQMALTIGLGIAVLVFPERRPTDLKPMRVAEFILWVMAIITTFGFDRVYTASNLPRNVLNGLLTYVLPFYLMRSCIGRKEDIPRLFACIVGAAVALTAFALFEAKMGWAPIDSMLMRLGNAGGAAKSSVLRGGMLRASATFGVTLAFAMFMAIAVVAGATYRDRFRSKKLWRVTMLALFMGLLLAQSRGAWLALVVSVATFYALRGKFAQLIGAATAGGVAFALLLAASTMSPRIAAFLGTNPSAGGEIGDYRQQLFTRGVEEGKKAPLIGQDINVVQSKMPDLRQGEGIIDFVNTYLTFFLCGGLLGLVPFVLGEFVLLVRLALEARRKATSPQLQRSQYFVGAMLGGVMVFLFFCSLADRVPLLFIILLAAAKMAAKPRAAAAERRPQMRRLRRPKLVQEAVA